MNCRRFVVGGILVAVLTIPFAAWACSAAGPNTHVGQLMAVDTTGKTFTIFDSQTASPISFISDDTILKDLEIVRGRIQVKYEDIGGVLKAIDVLY